MYKVQYKSLKTNADKWFTYQLYKKEEDAERQAELLGQSGWKTKVIETTKYEKTKKKV